MQIVCLQTLAELGCISCLGLAEYGEKHDGNPMPWMKIQKDDQNPLAIGNWQFILLEKEVKSTHLVNSHGLNFRSKLNDTRKNDLVF